MIRSMAQFLGQKWVSRKTHLKMSSIQHGINPTSLAAVRNLLQESTHSPASSSSASRISPVVLFIIVILAVLFFISGLLHLLVRFLTKKPSDSESRRNLGDSTSSETLQRQLQQLFHLHDSGLDQAFIDALPVFSYEEIMGPKEPFDCAVCLCEFSETDQLRLLTMCSHAFHINCIDTWLLSNSSCPLCRGSLFDPHLSNENPVFSFDDSKEDDGYPSNYRESRFTTLKKVEIDEVAKEKGVFPVRLGKFRKLKCVEEEMGGETSSSKLDGRRCYSMGSYQYLLADSKLMVSLSQDRAITDEKDVIRMKQESNQVSVEERAEGKKIGIGAKTDSYSISKIWLWSKKGKFDSSNARTDNQSPPTLELPWMRRTEGV